MADTRCASDQSLRYWVELLAGLLSIGGHHIGTGLDAILPGDAVINAVLGIEK